MEKILVAIDGRHEAWEAINHACSLAKRIDVLINVLLVLPNRGKNRTTVIGNTEAQLKQRIELTVETAKAAGVMINYFITEGSYEEEIISFINNNKITLLMCQTQEGEGQSTGREMAALRALQHRIGCKMAIVAPKRTTSNE